MLRICSHQNEELALLLPGSEDHFSLCRPMCLPRLILDSFLHCPGLQASCRTPFPSHASLPFARLRQCICQEYPCLPLLTKSSSPSSSSTNYLWNSALTSVLSASTCSNFCQLRWHPAPCSWKPSCLLISLGLHAGLAYPRLSKCSPTSRQQVPFLEWSWNFPRGSHLT